MSSKISVFREDGPVSRTYCQWYSSVGQLNVIYIFLILANNNNDWQKHAFLWRSDFGVAVFLVWITLALSLVVIAELLNISAHMVPKYIVNLLHIMCDVLFVSYPTNLT